MLVTEIPRSALIGPTKTLKVCDWPGPLAKSPSPATATMTQP